MIKSNLIIIGFGEICISYQYKAAKLFFNKRKNLKGTKRFPQITVDILGSKYFIEHAFILYKSPQFCKFFAVVRTYKIELKKNKISSCLLVATLRHLRENPVEMSFVNKNCVSGLQNCF